MTPRLVCRAASGPGLGHVVRSGALAQAWIDAGGAAVLSLDRAVPQAADLVPGVPLVAETDLDPAGADWCCVDDPALGAEDVGSLRHSGTRVLVLDDHGRLGGRGADLALDQNLGAPAAGVRYALLRRPFRRDPHPVPRAGAVVLLGGGPSAATRGFGAAVAVALAASDVPVDLLAGGSAMPVEVPAVRVHPFVADPSPLLARAAVAVSTAGSSAWELCRTGVAPVLVAVADDQEPVGEALAAAGAARYLGRLPAVDPGAVAEAVKELLRRPEALAGLAVAGAALVDGRGAERVVARLRSELVALRPAGEQDARLLLDWANDPEVRAASLSRRTIGWDEHVAWLRDRLACPDRPTWIALWDGEAVGHVRFDPGPEPGTAEISVSLAAEARGRRLAAAVIAAGTRAVLAALPVDAVVARVRPENERSQRAFLAADFDATGADAEGIRWFRRPRAGRWA